MGVQVVDGDGLLPYTHRTHYYIITRGRGAARRTRLDRARARTL